MWPFARRSALTLDEAIENAVPYAAQAWSRFRDTTGLPANLHLRDQIAYFARDFIGDLERSFPALRSAPNDLLLLIIAQGIEASGHVPRRKIELQLGIILPQPSSDALQQSGAGRGR